MVYRHLRGCDYGQYLLLSHHKGSSGEAANPSHLTRNDQAKKGKLHLRCH